MYMHLIDQNIKVNGLEIKEVVMVYWNMQMVMYIMDFGKKVKDMVKVYIIIQMEMYIKVNL
jgi:hypothetical protein